MQQFELCQLYFIERTRCCLKENMQCDTTRGRRLLLWNCYPQRYPMAHQLYEFSWLTLPWQLTAMMKQCHVIRQHLLQVYLNLPAPMAIP